MKTTILTIATIFTLAIGTVTTSFAAANNNAEEVATVLTNVSQINKIEIRGNVQLFVSDGSADQVKVYNRYYAESAMVQNENGVLRIASYNAKTLVVWVTAADLRTISAYDNAEVKSFGNLSKIDLDVNLYNNASAKLNLDAYKANITVNDRAKADVTGNVTEYNLVRDQSATVNNSDLAAIIKSEKITNKFTPAKAELAIL
jgi:phage gp45-like